ncbi:MAG: FtsB family cell division protein [Gaiellaceae bacterium]
MAARGRRRTSRRRSRSALALRWIGALVLVVIAVGYVQPLRAYRDAQDDVAGRQAEVDRIARANAELDERLAEAETTGFVEREARRLGLVKPGERLYIITGIDEWNRSRR